jgi:hypothetical protein
MSAQFPHQPDMSSSKDLAFDISDKNINDEEVIE